MQENVITIQNIVQETSDHEKIRQRLAAKNFYYFDEIAKQWRSITNFTDPCCPQDRIQIRCKYARTTLYVPYPFRLSQEVAFLMGLIAGSRYKKQRLEICIDATQKERISDILQQLGIVDFEILDTKYNRKSYYAKADMRRYKKIQIKLPYVLKKYLEVLGYNSKRLKIPEWFPIPLQEAWLEGYLNSSKLQLRLKKVTFMPQLTIFIEQNSTPLLQSILPILDSCAITYSIYRIQGRLQLSIHRKKSVLRLLEKFEINRPKVLAIKNLIQKVQEDPYISFAFQKYPLTDFQLTLLGLIFQLPHGEQEYSILTHFFACSSNDIRQALYVLEQIGFIKYYSKENHKEFFARSKRYTSVVLRSIQAEEEELRRVLKCDETNALSFYCHGCARIVSYTEAMHATTFACPDCGSPRLHPVEVTKFFSTRLEFLTNLREKLTGGS